MSAQNQQHDPYGQSNGVRERYTLAGVLLGVLSVGGALYFIFETVPSITLVLIALLMGGGAFITYRVTRSVTRDHDAEIVQAGMAGMQRAIEFMERAYEIKAQKPPPQFQLPPPSSPPSISFTQADDRKLVRDPDPVPAQPAAPVPDVDPDILLAFAEMIGEGINPSLGNLGRRMRVSDNNDYTDALDFLGDGWVERGGERRPTKWTANVWGNPSANAEALRAQAHAIREWGG